MTNEQLKDALRILDDLMCVSGHTQITQLTISHGVGITSTWQQTDAGGDWVLVR